MASRAFVVAVGCLGIVLMAAGPNQPAPFAMEKCAAGTSTVAANEAGNPQARHAAQKGLDFLGKEASAWQQGHQCFGCHVQAVTLEAMSVGVHNQYSVPKSALDDMLNGMLRIPGGARRPRGFSYHDDSLLAPSKAFGGAAFARYDQWVNSTVRDDLPRVAKELLEYQQQDGSIRLDWTNPPVGAGTIQGTFQAMQTWRQTYTRTADDKWLPPIRKAEKYIQAQVASWKQAPPANLQDANYALMALGAAGVGNAEESVQRLTRSVLASQNRDGGWGFQKGGESNAFATGQTLYALRLVGLTDRDPVVARGTTWLTSHQAEDGGWSHAGFGKAEAMWGVLGLVSVDVLTVAINGLQDGQHVDGVQQVAVEARDNQGGGVTQVELLVDDLRVFGACGSKLTYAWNTANLETGKHIVDAVAVNAKGQRSLRRIEVYAGSLYLTQLGSRFSDNGTVFSLRNIAPETVKGSVALEIHDVKEVEGLPKAGDKVYGTSQAAAAPGPMSFFWDGKGSDGKARPRGRYVAQVSFKDLAGKAVQTEELFFTHDTDEAQRANYAQVQGQLKLGGAAPAANTPVELVDDKGRVVQRTVSTEAGQYRFKNVDAGKYKVRISKRGFRAMEQDIQAGKAEEAEASANLLAE